MEPEEDKPNEVVVCHLGHAEYEPTWDLQRRLQSSIAAAKQVDPNHREPHVILTVEHPPVYTLGKSGDVSNLLIGSEELSAEGATFIQIDRGGDITFHGPGQLVVYPILDLGHFFQDIHRYLRTLEDVVIATCRDFGIDAGRSIGRTGVWIGPDDRGAERKICAMGIKCSRWVTSHGLALNVNTDLKYFQNIVPCGIADRGVTSLSAEMDRDVEISDVAPVIIGHMARLFDVAIRQFSGEPAYEYLRGRLGEQEQLTRPMSEEHPKTPARKPIVFDDTRR
jgi:lipoyl(octanoyl) transferase